MPRDAGKRGPCVCFVRGSSGGPGACAGTRSPDTTQVALRAASGRGPEGACPRPRPTSRSSLQALLRAVPAGVRTPPPGGCRFCWPTDSGHCSGGLPMTLPAGAGPEPVPQLGCQAGGYLGLGGWNVWSDHRDPRRGSRELPEPWVTAVCSRLQVPAAQT